MESTKRAAGRGAFGAGFQDLLIRRKLMVLLILTSLVSGLITGASWLWYEARSAHERLIRDMASMAEVVGANTARDLSERRAEDARVTLSTLAPMPGLESAFVFDVQGEILAEYRRGGPGTELLPPFRLTGEEVVEGRLLVYRPVSFQGVTKGSI